VGGAAPEGGLEAASLEAARLEALPGVGELYIRGASTFEGYHGKEHLTAQAYDEGGWLKTGYVCSWAPSGELHILGKRNDFLHPAGGRLVSAQRLEAIYAHRCPLVHQIWVTCEPRGPLVAVAALDAEAVFRWLQAEGLDLRSSDEHAPRITAALLQQLREVAAACRLEPCEEVSDVHVVKSLGQSDDDYRQLATPTFVLRRGHLRRRYDSELRALEIRRAATSGGAPGGAG